MGWASFFEDISLRAAESGGGGFVSAAAESFVLRRTLALEEARQAQAQEEATRALALRRAQALEEARRECSLAAAAARQRNRCRQVSWLANAYAWRVSQEFRENQWLALSARMDRVSEEVAKLPQNTLFAGEGQLYKAEADVAEEIDAVLSAAKKAAKDLVAMQTEISDLLKLVNRNEQEVENSAVSDRDPEAGEKASWFAHGYRALAKQVADGYQTLQKQVAALEEHAENLIIEMDNGILERVMESASMQVEDKDTGFLGATTPAGRTLWRKPK